MRNFIVLLLAVLALGMTACNHEEIPYEIWIDSSFSPEESEVVISAVDEWNEAAAKHGLRAFTLKGFTNDSYGEGDDHDDRAVVYRTTHAASGVGGHTTGRASVNDDALIFVEELAHTAEWVYLTDLRATTLHELGHVVGIAHSSNRDDVMYKERLWGRDHLTEGDVDLFCDVNGC